MADVCSVHSMRWVVVRDGADYRATCGDELNPAGSYSFRLPLGPEDLEELRWYLEGFVQFVEKGSEIRAHKVARQLEAWGRQLFLACFPGGEESEPYRRLLGAARAGHQVLLTLCSQDNAFLMQPWELMRDASGPLAFQGMSLRRELPGPLRLSSFPPRFEPPLRILLIVARPTDQGFIDPRTSLAPILDSIDRLPAGAVELALCRPPTLARVEEMISAARKSGRPFHIVHFDGHGYHSDRGVGGLSFEKDDRSEDRIGARPFGDLLSRLQIPLVLLEACRTSKISPAAPIGSLAPALLGSGIGSVVAFSHNIHVATSRILVERFYAELAQGLTVGQALAEGRTALRADPFRFLYRGPKAETIALQDWFVAQLYQVGKDPVLFAGPADSSAAGARSGVKERMHFFPPQPVCRFHGRARDLLELERDFENHGAVVVTGIGGMGKTALACEAARWWLRAGIFEAAVFVSFEQPTLAGRVAAELGRAIEGVSFLALPEEERLAAALRIFRQRRILLVWDNFESVLPQFQEEDELGLHSAEEVERLRSFHQQLVETGGESRLLVTCRPAKSSLRGIKERPLAGLDRPDSLHLIHAIAELKAIDLGRKGYGRDELELLLDLLGDHPLSIALVGPHLASLEPAQIRERFAELLKDFADEIGEGGKNRSLLASLAFSTSRLSAQAKAFLPVLALFRVGACEEAILHLAKAPRESWPAVRRELEEIALVLPEAIKSPLGPFLRFHPTLPFASRRLKVFSPVGDELDFAAAYTGLGIAVDALLLSERPEVAVELMEKEESNFRLAIAIAFRYGKNLVAWQIADPLINYLRLAGRGKEWEQSIARIRAELPREGPLDQAVWAVACDQAIELSLRGRIGEAEGILLQMIERLGKEKVKTDAEPGFHLGTTFNCLAEILLNGQEPHRAWEASRRAIDLLEDLSQFDAQANLAAAWGNLANALLAMDRPDEALRAAEKSLAINQKLDNQGGTAIALARLGAILVHKERFSEAEARLQQATSLAEKYGDNRAITLALRQLAESSLKQGNDEQAIERLQKAIPRFRQSGDLIGEVGSFILLAEVEKQRGKLDIAEAWCQKARELAAKAEFRVGLALADFNLALLARNRSEKARSAAESTDLLRRAAQLGREALDIRLEAGHLREAGNSHAQLAMIHFLLGELRKAEEHGCEGLRLRELADESKICFSCHDLASIAAWRGDSNGAREWIRRREEACRRSGLPPIGTDPLDVDQIHGAVHALAAMVLAARQSRSRLEPEAEAALEFLLQMPKPIAEMGHFLRAALNAEELPKLPESLPGDFSRLFAELREALMRLPS